MSPLSRSWPDLPGAWRKKTAPGPSAWFLASHHLHGVHAGDGVRYLDRALDHLQNSYRPEATLALADRALAEAGLLAGPQRLEVLLRKVAHLHLLGRREEEGAVLEEARVLAVREAAKMSAREEALARLSALTSGPKRG